MKEFTGDKINEKQTGYFTYPVYGRYSCVSCPAYEAGSVARG
jgi:hypothetical protein